MDEFDNHYWTEGLNDDDSMMAKFIRPGATHLINSIKDWDGFKELHQKLDGKLNYHLDQVLNAIQKPQGYRVLNHGDFHAKNMMLRNDGRHYDDVIFVRHIYLNTYFSFI